MTNKKTKKNSEGKDGSSKPDITPTAKAGQELQGQEGTRRALHYMHSNPSIHPSIHPFNPFRLDLTSTLDKNELTTSPAGADQRMIAGCGCGFGARESPRPVAVAKHNGMG